MQIRDIRLGAVLVPIGVALVLIGALTWYQFARVPAREAALNERNLRLLSTMSGAIKAKIESFDGALDHAVASFKPAAGKDALATFQKGVGLFAPDLEILALDPSSQRRAANDPNAPEMRLLKAAADPPRVLVERDEGRFYLYFGARLENDEDGSVLKVFARTDLDAVIGPLLDGKDEFTAVMVTTENGEVIAQNSSIGLTLARLDGVIALRPGAAAKDSPQPGAFATLSSFANMVPATIGQVGYKLYMQPISFSLLSMKTLDGERQAEHWVLCGLVREDRFTAESAALSYTTLLWFSGMLAIFTLSLSFVKLRAIGARERWRSGDARWVTATAFMAVGLLTLGALDIWAFGAWFANAVDQRLHTVATAIGARVNAEAARVDRQGTKFEHAVGTRFDEVATQLRANQVVPTIKIGAGEHGTVSCDPPSACTTNLLASAIDIGEYPFFDLVTWAGTNGWQRVRWTPGSRIRPFINIFEEKIPYAARVQAVWNAAEAAPARSMNVISSPTTGEPLTVFWRTGPPKGTQARDKWVQSIAMTSLVSLDRPILPKGVSYAVVDKDGVVLFHTEPNRRLRENFLKECEDDSSLGALLQDGRTDQLAVRYRGRNIRLSISPLAFDDFTGADDPQWRLLVFQDATIVDTVNLETVTIACWLFAIYACILAIVGITMVRVGVLRRHWFWPDPGKRSAYWMAALLNGAAIGLFAAIFRIGTARQRPDAILAATFLLTIVTAVVTYWIVSHAPTEEDTHAFGWRHPFYLARATFLFVLATLPAAACFHAAYTFETTLLTKSELAQWRADATALDTRVAETTAHIGQPRLDVADQLREFLSKATYAPLWEVAYVPTERALALETLNGVLLRMHRRYNDTAIGFDSSARDITAELASSARETAMPVPAPPPTPSVGWLLTAIAVVLVCCHSIVYWLMRPMFALEAFARPSSTATGDVPAPHVLILGPPGSGKSAALAQRPDVRVFDVSIRGWVERRKKLVAVPKERRRALLPAAAVGEFRYLWQESSARDSVEEEISKPPAPAATGGGGWADTFDYATLPRAMAIDHIDYRLEEHDFASQTLTFVERAAYRGDCAVQIVGDRDPIACLRDSGAPPSEIDRWVRALGSFRKVVASVPARDRETPETASTATPYYESLWNACSIDERLTLRQLADEGVVNPQNQAVVRSLMQTGLIARDPTVRIANPAFREFVLHAVSADQITEWERRGVAVPWGSIEIALLTGVAVLAGLLLVTQEQLLNAWIGFIPVLLPVAKPTAETVWKLFSALRPSGAKNAVVG